MDKAKEGSRVESGVPGKIGSSDIGTKVLFRIPNNTVVLEGVIDELSPEGEYIHIGKRWIANDGNGILAIIGTKKRSKAL